MEKEYLSIREVAELASVSYSAIYKRLNSTLKEYVEVVEGHKMLKIEVLERLGLNKNSTVEVENSSTVEKNSTQNSTQNSTPSNAEKEEISQINQWQQGIIDDLRQQLKEKDIQIQKQNDQIVDLSNKMAELFHNNQKLQLNYQLLLGNSTAQQAEEENEQSAPEQSEVIKEEPKKTFFQRLFGL